MLPTLKDIPPSGLSSSQKGGIIANDGSINIKGYELNNNSGIIETNAIFPAAGQALILQWATKSLITMLKLIVQEI
ncbi:hypothetical protein AB6F55_06775 [Providencia hangzhouensis]